MAFKLLTKPIVFVDIDEAVDYEKKVNGLGKRFYKAVFEMPLCNCQSFYFQFKSQPLHDSFTIFPLKTERFYIC